MNKIDSIIRTKSYTALTAAEKELLADLIDNEQEFNQIKRVYQLAAKQKHECNVHPKLETKESLDAFFQKKHAFPAHEWHKNEPKTIPYYQKKWLKYAAVIAISVSLSTYILLQSTQQEQRFAQTINLKKPTANLDNKNIQKKQSTTETSNKKEVELTSPHLLTLLDPTINKQNRDSEKQNEASVFDDQVPQMNNDATKDNVASFTTIQPTYSKNDSRMTMNSDDSYEEKTMNINVNNSLKMSVSNLINFTVPAF